MRRSAYIAVLSFLLLFMQQQATVHALSHLAPQLAHSSRIELVAPHAGAACVECALLATGTSAAIGADPSLVSVVPAPGLVRSAYRSRAADAPVYFSSRAPPILL
jgi:hypothetical protein